MHVHVQKVTINFYLGFKYDDKVVMCYSSLMQSYTLFIIIITNNSPMQLPHEKKARGSAINKQTKTNNTNYRIGGSHVGRQSALVGGCSSQ